MNSSFTRNHSFISLHSRQFEYEFEFNFRLPVCWTCLAEINYCEKGFCELFWLQNLWIGASLMGNGVLWYFYYMAVHVNVRYYECYEFCGINLTKRDNVLNLFIVSTWLLMQIFFIKSLRFCGKGRGSTRFWIAVKCRGFVQVWSHYGLLSLDFQLFYHKTGSDSARETVILIAYWMIAYWLHTEWYIST